MKPLVIVLARIGFLAFVGIHARAQSLLWTQSIGSAVNDHVFAAAADGSGGAFVSGSMSGGAGGPFGGSDAWVASCDGLGSLRWVVPFGSSADDEALGAAADGSGGVFLAGWTAGNLAAPNAGFRDAWLARYDAQGQRSWARQLGTAVGHDVATAIAGDDAGGAFVAGWTLGSLGGPAAGGTDRWLARYDANGNQLWLRQFGLPGSDEVWALSSDGQGRVFAGGQVFGDSWVALFDAAGNQQWSHIGGVAYADAVQALASDGAGGAFAAGFTNWLLGDQVLGGQDAWLSHYTPSGVRNWVRQFGSSVDDTAWGLAADGAGGVFIAFESLGTVNETGGHARYDATGHATWSQPLVGTDDVSSRAVVRLNSTSYLVAIDTFIGGQYDVRLDAFDATFVSTYCTSGTSSSGCHPSISGSGTPSATAASGFSIAADQLEGDKTALLLYGIDNRGYLPVPWSGTSSFLCIQGAKQRTATMVSGGHSGLCDGALALDWNAFRATHSGALGQPFTQGDHVFVQAWFRDPASLGTTMLSNALEFVLAP